MQILDSCEQKNSLLNTMNRFIGAVNNMDQTVMVPSLLRDVPLDHHTGAATYLDQDMYSSYVLLKSIRNDIEWGVVLGEGRGKGCVDVAAVDVAVEDEELKKQFQFHLHGLLVVLSKLTRKANTLTTRYKEEIGCGN